MFLTKNLLLVVPHNEVLCVPLGGIQMYLFYKYECHVVLIGS